MILHASAGAGRGAAGFAYDGQGGRGVVDADSRTVWELLDAGRERQSNVLHGVGCELGGHQGDVCKELAPAAAELEEAGHNCRAWVGLRASASSSTRSTGGFYPDGPAEL